eukprot:3346955-Amphidinium_carterae.1
MDCCPVPTCAQGNRYFVPGTECFDSAPLVRHVGMHDREYMSASSTLGEVAHACGHHDASGRASSATTLAGRLRPCDSCKGDKHKCGKTRNQMHFS